MHPCDFRAKGRAEKLDQYGFPVDAPVLGSPQPRRAAARSVDAAALDALLTAGAGLAQTVRDLADDTRASAPDDPETEAAAAVLEEEWAAWEAAYAAVEGGAR